MTPIESIYEIEADLVDLQSYLYAKNTWVAKNARGKYEQLVDRFFREHGRLIDPDQRYNCLRNHEYFLKLMESTSEHYYSDQEYLP